MVNRDGLLAYLKKNGQLKTWADLDIQYKYPSGNAARNMWLRYRQANNIDTASKPLKFDKSKYEQNLNLEKGQQTIRGLMSDKALSEEEIYVECNIDKSKWILTQIWHKKRGTGFVYSANFKLLPQAIVIEKGKTIYEMLSKYITSYKPMSQKDIFKNKTFTRPCSVLISLTDSHLDQMDLKETTLDDRIKNYKETLNTLILKAYNSNLVEEVVYVVGNDGFNSDNFLNSTTMLTQQYPNAQWDVAYEKVFEMQVECINKLKQFCDKLYVLSVSGNHDLTKGFYLSHALEVYFKNDKSIIFDRSSEPTKVHNYGVTALFFHHGNIEPKQLPLYMASKYPKEWGLAKYHTVGIGDKHHKQSWNMRVNLEGQEIEGVRIFMTPALCGPNQWSKSKLFDNAIPAGICHIYDKEKGYCMELEERV